MIITAIIVSTTYGAGQWPLAPINVQLTAVEMLWHVYFVMRNDSYRRYCNSTMYTDYANGTKKKTSVKGLRSVISFTAKKDPGASS
ncbi:hypothetical protein V5799_014836 [Amblyomma americanum]|uniref:Uncharacterized protein n=1 Tax=Amblyomma americanum TaxID=6943 RepID=A0AAQ4E1V7_AMBAM